MMPEERFRRLLAAWAVSFCLALPGGLAGQSPGADSLIAWSIGENGGFGADSLPGIVLGLPEGAGELEGSLDVVSLGSGGSITLSFEDETIVDGPGPDFTVFENPFFVSGDSLNRYIETGIVEVSRDGVAFSRFPFDILPDVEPPGNPHRYLGFAGIDPVMSNGGVPDPTDPVVSGGDQFDLETVGLPNARFVRIIDTGTDTYDSDGDLVTDTGLNLPPQAGFDLDAVCRINWTSRADPFRVVSARGVLPDTIRVTFSKPLEPGRDIPPAFFALDGKALSDEDGVIRFSDTDLSLRLIEGLPPGAPGPVLTVSQHIGSAGGEHLLDPFDGEVEMPAGIRDENEPEGADGHTVLSSYPNPFNGSTTITFALPGPGEVSVAVFDLRGKRVKTLMEETAGGGTHRICWDGRNDRGGTCPSGIYFVNITGGGMSRRMKIIHRK